MISAELLFAVEPSLDAGAMAKLRSRLVCRDQLVEFADQFDLFSELKYNLANNNAFEGNLLADSFEAYIGAYYLDSERIHATTIPRRPSIGAGECQFRRRQKQTSGAARAYG
jgi:dsRNA-specific ribonuclease